MNTSSPRAGRGFSLIEMMVALVLGLLVTGSAIGIFTANRRANLGTDTLGRIQENERTAFELMAREVREAGGNACGKNLPVVSVVNGSTAAWWANFNNPVFGYDGGQPSPGLAFGAGVGDRVNGTDAIEIKAMSATGVSIVDHVPASAQFNLTANSGLMPGDIAVACDNRQMSIFQVTGPASGNTTNLVHNTGGSVTPGNCSKGLGLPSLETPLCSSVNDPEYQFSSPFEPSAMPNPGVLASFQAQRWYIGINARGDRSLFSATLRNVGGVANIVREEIVEGVTDMQITYLVMRPGAPPNAAYQTAADVGLVPADWGNVVSVRVALTLQGVGPGVAGTDGNALQRNMSHVIALRNRMP